MGDKNEQVILDELRKRGRDDLIANIEQRRADATPAPTALTEAEGPSLGSEMMTYASTLPSLAPQAAEFVKQAALPTAGNLAGAAVGAMTGPFAPVAVPALEGVGGMAGLKANEMLGISQPTAAEYALQGLAPAVFRGASAAWDLGKKFGTPGRAAETLNALAPDEAALQMGKLPRPMPSSKQLFEQLEGSQMLIDAAPWKQEAEKLLVRESKLAGKDPGLVSYLTKLTKKFGKNGSMVNVNEFQDELVWLGRKAGQEGGAYKDLYKFASQSMDEAIKAAQLSAPDSPAVRTGATALFQARQAFKREQVFHEIDDAIDAAFKLQSKGGATRQFDAKQVVKAIEGNQFFAQAFSPQEQETVKHLFYTLNEIPALKPGAGVNAGSLRAITRAIFPAAAGSSIGMAAGGPVGASVGFAAGAILPPAMEVASLLKLAYRTEAGRDLMADILTKSQGKLTTQGLVRLSAALAAQLSARNPEPPSVAPSMTGLPSMTPQPMEVMP